MASFALSNSSLRVATGVKRGRGSVRTAGRRFWRFRTKRASNGPVKRAVMTIKCDGKLGNAAGHRGKACADVQAARESIMHHINGGTRPFRFSIQSERYVRTKLDEWVSVPSDDLIACDTRTVLHQLELGQTAEI